MDGGGGRWRAVEGGGGRWKAVEGGGWRAHREVGWSRRAQDLHKPEDVRVRVRPKVVEDRELAQA